MPDPDDTHDQTLRAEQEQDPAAGDETTDDTTDAADDDADDAAAADTTDTTDTDTEDAPDVPEVGTEEARAAWADAAREVLLETAQRYQAVVTSKDLALEVQDRTGIHTTQPSHHWIGDVLTRVAVTCDQRDEPNLAALCVKVSGSVGDGYGVAVGQVTGETPEDPDAHAAKERLASHRYFDAKDLPADGGFAVLVPTLQRSRDRARRARLADAPIATCPKCHMALPKTGICDNCD